MFTTINTMKLLLLLLGVTWASTEFNRDLSRERDGETVRIPEACVGKVMDLFFLLDSSSSIYIADFWTHRSLARDVASRFDIGPERTRIGLLTFSDDMERPVVGLNRYLNKNDLLNAINEQNLPYRKGPTNSELAIRYVRQLGDFRQNITKVMVIMTDGSDNNPGPIALETRLARDAGFYIIVFGYGEYQNGRMWRDIASDPDELFVYNTSSARTFENVKFTMPQLVCALPPIIGSCDVSQMSELYFVASRGASSVSIEMIATLKRRTRDQRDLLRLSYMIEACGNVASVSLDDEDVVCNLFAPRTGDTTTSVNNLFTNARELARNSRNGGDRDINQVIVLFADDPTLNLTRFEWFTNAQSAAAEGVKVIVFDLGLRLYTDFAARMATSPNHVVRYTDSAMSTVRLFVDTTCDALNMRRDGPNLSDGVN